MSKPLSYYAWYPAAYRADTRHLTREEHFAYREIIDEIFLCGQERRQIRDDDEYLRVLARATPEEWPKIRKALIDGPRALLVKKGGWISSRRLTEEIEKAEVKSKKGKHAAAVRWQCPSNASAMHQHESSNAIREEKIREETNTPPLSPPSGGAPPSRAEVPEDYIPSAADRQWALDNGLSDAAIIRETERFVRHYRGKGSRLKRPDQTWRNWITGKFAGGVADNGNGDRPTVATESPPAPVAATPAREPNAWSEVVARISDEFSDEFLRDAKLIEDNGDTLDVGVPTQRHVDAIRERYGGQIRRELGRGVEVHFRVGVQWQ